MKRSRKILAVLLAICMIASTMAVAAYAEPFDGTWTAITNASELKAIENDMSGKYYLANDIALTGSWEPIGWIGNDDVYFEGTFDGNGHTISGLYHVGDNDTSVGLFARNGGTIKNVTLYHPSLEGALLVGGIAGGNAGLIENCHIKNCVIDAKSATTNPNYFNNYGKHAGGITGQNGSQGTIRYCSVSEGSDVSGNLFTGGICGSN